MKSALVGGLAALGAALLFGQAVIPPNVQRALGSITAANLKGDLSFLASDAMRGRYTPSPELDIAADFIASQFREAGLEPGGNQDYFQSAEMMDRHMGKALSALTLHSGERTITVPADSVVVAAASQAANIENAPVFVAKSPDPAPLDGIKPGRKSRARAGVQFFQAAARRGNRCIPEDASVR